MANQVYPPEAALDYQRIVDQTKDDIFRSGRQFYAAMTDENVDTSEAITQFQEAIDTIMRGYRDATMVAQMQRQDAQD